MLHFVAFAFFSTLLLVAGVGMAALLHSSRRQILAALRLDMPPVVVTVAGPSRVRVRYASTARRITSPLRAVA